MTTAIALRNSEAFEDVCSELRRWLDSATAGEMDGDEMLSRLGSVSEHLDDATLALRRALGW